MALFTQAHAKTELTDRLGGRGDLAGTPNRLEHWLDAAKFALAKTDLEFPLLDVTRVTSALTADTSEFVWTSSPVTLVAPLGIHHVTNNVTGQLMQWFNWTEYRSLVGQATGSPVRWSRFGNKIAVDPQPVTGFLDTLRIDYRTRPTTNILSQFDDEWHEVIIEIASYLGLKSLKQFTQAKEVMAGLPQVIQIQLAQPTSETFFEQRGNEMARVYV